jgi:hypothetical protein
MFTRAIWHKSGANAQLQRGRSLRPLQRAADMIATHLVRKHGCGII